MFRVPCRSFHVPCLTQTDSLAALSTEVNHSTFKALLSDFPSDLSNPFSCETFESHKTVSLSASLSISHYTMLRTNSRDIFWNRTLDSTQHHSLLIERIKTRHLNVPRQKKWRLGSRSPPYNHETRKHVAIRSLF